MNDLFDFRKQEYTVAFDIAIVYYGLNDRNKIYEWFEIAYQERDPRLTRIKTEPFWDSLRSDPGFIALLKKMGLEK
ncbi:MAG: hypothetical protein PHD25_00805 [Bacteroidales bacterium]|nr:hypothetical protein [Bacteroidales bacterium]